MCSSSPDKSDALPVQHLAGPTDGICGHAVPLLITTSGQLRCVYTEAIDLASLGRLAICRGSHVEPDEAGRWYADLAPAGGPRLGPFRYRSDALKAEAKWLEVHWLERPTE